MEVVEQPLNTPAIYDKIVVNGEVCLVIPFKDLEVMHMAALSQAHKLRAALGLPVLQTGKQRRKQAALDD